MLEALKTMRIVGVLIMVGVLASPVQARDWYFDKESRGGNCSNAGAGDINHPFCNIFNKLWDGMWNGAAAGDTIYIRGGTYTQRLFWIKAGVLDNGTAENPIHIKAYPGETVIFDGQGWDNLIRASGYTNYMHDLHFEGPFEAKNYTTVFDGETPSGFRTNLTFDNWTIHDGSAGFILRHVKNVVISNSTFYNLKGFASSIGDNVIGVSVRGDTVHISDNITIENCLAHDINDGKGGDNGDSDGFHTDEYVDHFTIRNSFAFRCGEDGIDTKAKNVIMENVGAWNNGASGIKLWAPGQGSNATHVVRRALVYGNRETGMKCTGRGLGDNNILTATIDHLTAWGNGENGFKNIPGGDTSDGCTATIRNSVFGAQRDTAIALYAPRSGHSATTNILYTDVYHTGVRPIIPPGCSPLASTKWTSAQYLEGMYNTDMASGYSCNSPYGSLHGTATHPFTSDPKLAGASTAFEWTSISAGEITNDTVKLFTEPSYPWPTPTVGHYVEIDDDGIRRQITSVGDGSTRTITFTPAVSSSVCGARIYACRGVRIVGWATNTIAANDFRLSNNSPVIDAGLYVTGTHCVMADDKGGKNLSGCIHWVGAAPDPGFYEYGLLSPPNYLHPKVQP